ncbi:phosphopantetheine-binding protein [Streptomyces chartreusis]|uniref:Trypsin-like peptidase domain-containing protein n=1 Tax=Streptomyces chartreusis TaxID=1969 RepID=A0A7H8T288_STRCX|nr:phosphopantetheine-binding protein [Streptomyces chartreusis]QKZ17616.1 trypsin-like peptidase domain-containing protein [Streptomyces chartreusis]
MTIGGSAHTDGDRELRRHVVKVVGEAGRILGTGFFAAPGLVLTAAHVVGDEQVVELVAAATAYETTHEGRSGKEHELKLSARVVARSRPRTEGALWPFPDLAVLRITTVPLPEHPCVRLAPTDPDPEQDCRTWGFARREYGIEPHGSPATFRCEGVEGDGSLRLKGGQASPGLSGAPLVCPRSRAVVAVITASRGIDGDLGGWATPISALLPGTHPEDELAAWGGELLTRNEETFLADRASWNRVLPMRDHPGHTALSRPWGTFNRGPRTSPADLLRADYGIVPYAFRDDALADIERWCEQPQAIALAQVAAPGGAGKSRFALELARRTLARGWVSGLWTRERDTGALAALALPRLAIVDYAEAVDTASLCGLLEILSAHASPAAPVRVLLLTRGQGASARAPLTRLDEDAPAALRAVVDHAEDITAAVRPLDLEERATLHDRAVHAFAEAWGVTLPTLDTARPDLTGDAYGRPLDVLFEAYDTVLGGGSGGDRVLGVERVLSHERRYWGTTAPAVPGLRDAARRRAVAAATLAAAADGTQAHALLAAALPDLGIDDRQTVVDWLADAYTGDALLNPLRPDRLGEAFLASELAQEQRAGALSGARTPLLEAVLGLPHGTQVAHSLDVLARLAASTPTAIPAIARALTARLPDLVERATTAAKGTARHPARPELAGSLLRCLDGPVLAETAAGVEGGDLAHACLRLGDLARSTGGGRVGEALYERARDLYEESADTYPTRRPRPELVALYGRLGDAARARGDFRQAAERHRQALRHIEELVAADPTDRTLLRAAAVSHDRLGELARLARDWDESERRYRRSLGILRTLAEPGAQPEEEARQLQRDTGVAYNRVGDLLRGRGRIAEALAHHGHALSITETLLACSPDDAILRRDLAVGHGRLGELHREQGDLDRAERHFGQSLRIREELARHEPANATYRRDLALGCARLAELAADRADAQRARELYRRSLTLSEELADGEPGNVVYRRDVEVVRQRLTTLAAKADRQDRQPLAMGWLMSTLAEFGGVEEGVDLDRADIADVPFLEIGYDSLAQLQVAGMLEREYGVTFDEEELVDADTPGRFLSLVNRTIGSEHDTEISDHTATQRPPTEHEIQSWLAARIAHHTGIGAVAILPEVLVNEIDGFGSVVFTQLVDDIEKTYGVYLPFSMSWVTTTTLQRLTAAVTAAVTDAHPATTA